MIGIYKLVFEGLEDWPYVGQSSDIERRYKAHVSMLQRGKGGKKLLEAFEIAGVPKLEIIEECSLEDLNEREIFWIAKLDAHNKGLNGSKGGDVYYGRGTEHSNSKYSEQEIIAVLKDIIASPNETVKEVTKRHNIPYQTVYSIKSGQTHQWIQEEYPELLEDLAIDRRKSGFQHQRAKFTKDQILEVFKLLQDPKLTLAEIEHNTGVSVAQINGIAKGRTHQWLQEEYPKEFNKIQDINRRSKCLYEEMSKTLISPEGVEYLVEDGPTELAYLLGEGKAFATGIGNLLRGDIRQYKGWVLKGNEFKVLITLISPDKKIYDVLEGKQAEFARTHDLCKTSLGNLIRNKQKTHRGWRIATTTEIITAERGEEKYI
jgi:hypothetical protein